MHQFAIEFGLAFDALQTAAAELSGASTLARSSALRADARILAAAVEAEVLALNSPLLRHA